MNDTHKSIKEAIQDSFDRNEPLPGHVAEHLKTCPECRYFKESLERFLLKLKINLDKNIADFKSPDFSHLTENPSGKTGKTAKKQCVRYLPWIAAVFLCAVISIFTFFGYQSRKVSLLIKKENQIFVEELFSRSIFDKGYTAEDHIFLTSWFETHETVPWLYGDFSMDEP